ncbi:MAG: type IV pilus modification PilV family protein [Thermodesulfobacteriota bacterium]
MNLKSDTKGFTLIEILVALGIMALGFLAVSQMQFLSLRQAGLAETGTTATNVIDLAANRDMQEMRRMHLLNSIAYGTAVKGGIPDLNYCNGSTGAACPTCPCNPALEILGINSSGLPPTQKDVLEDGIPFPNPIVATVCSPIDLNNFDPAEIVYSAAIADCQTNEFMLLRAVEGFRVPGDTQSDPDTINYRITYGIKTPREIARDNRQGVNNFNINLGRTAATQTYDLTAHIETDWDRFIAAWPQVIIPHIP